MKKLLGIVVLSLFFSNVVFGAGTFSVSKKYIGKGPLKLSQGMVDILEYHFSGGRYGKWKKKQKTVWNPLFLVMSTDGRHYSHYINSHGQHYEAAGNYLGKARSKCKKKSGKECFVFSIGTKIVWDNGINKKRKLKRKEIFAGKTPEILSELGFYNGIIEEKPKKIEKKKEKKELKKTKKTKTSSGDSSIAQKLKELNELYKSGALTKEEFTKAKAKLLQ